LALNHSETTGCISDSMSSVFALSDTFVIIFD
jgi:hypothetical protein